MIEHPTPDSYPWLEGTPTAAKLAASAIDPIVAAARGYQHITPQTLDAWLTARGTQTRSKRAATLREWTTLATGLTHLPWHPAGNPETTHDQFRPDTPIDPYGTGKTRKYMMEKGTPTPLDIHPAYPTQTPPKTLWITEGLLKADAITSQIIRETVNPEIHQYALEGITTGFRTSWQAGHESAQRHLATLLKDTTHLVIALVGVGNWHNNPEWDHIRIKNAETRIAFDADLATNHNVWKQANALARHLERKGTRPPAWLNLPRTEDAHLGIDDYIAAGHTLADIETHLGPLPEQPNDPDAQWAHLAAGDWRVTPGDPETNPQAGTTCQRKTTIKTPNGTPQTHWEHASDLAGRVAASITMRTPTPKEMATGRLDPAEESGTTAWELEIGWYRDGATGHATMTVPSNAFDGGKPANWARDKVKVPKEITRHREWPPDPKWFAAIKNHRTDETEDRIRFTRMGWVPQDTTGHNMAYLVGTQTVTADGIGDDPDTAAHIVDAKGNPERQARRYGFKPLVPPESLPPQLNTVAHLGSTAIGNVARAYTGPASPWSDTAIGLLSLACMWRPLAPVLPRLVIYYHGEQSSGKSWTASTSMFGWMKEPNTWTNQNLPGSARDSRAAAQLHTSTFPIYVRDDLAPSTSDRKAEEQESIMEELTRAIHDNSPRAVSHMGESLTETREPISLFIVTAENAPTVSSIVSRVAPVSLGKGSLVAVEGTEVAAMQTTLEASQATGALAQLACMWIAEHGWETARDMWNMLLDGANTTQGGILATVYGHPTWPGLRTIAKDLVSAKAPTLPQGTITRLANSAADLMATCWTAGYLWRCARKAAGEAVAAGHAVPVDFALTRELLEADDSDLAQMRTSPATYAQALALTDIRNLTRIVDLLVASRPHEKSGSPGKDFLVALSGALVEHKGHLEWADDPAALPPGIANPSEIGWTLSGTKEWTFGSSPLIGYVTTEADGRQVAWLRKQEAFRVARRTDKDLIPPGMKGHTTWKSLYDDGLAWGPRPSDKRTDVVKRIGGRLMRVFPVPLDLLLGQGEPPEA